MLFSSTCRFKKTFVDCIEARSVTGLIETLYQYLSHANLDKARTISISALYSPFLHDICGSILFYGWTIASPCTCVVIKCPG